MAGFSINDILGEASRAPADEKLAVVSVPLTEIRPNPENRKIYVIGDVSALKADILANGLRQPLEVIPDEDGGYMLLGGERRWTALGQLVGEGQARFARVPCIVRASRGADDDLLALITANSTARELTDAERLAQYEALKRIYEKKKAAGELDGRVRDAMAETLGVGAGTLGRLNAVSEHCSDEVKAMLREGKTTLTRAYDASKLWKRQQKSYCLSGYATPLPPMSAEQEKAVWDWIADNADFEGVDWMPDVSYSYEFNAAVDKLDVTAETSIGRVRIRKRYAYLLNETDPDDAVSVTYLTDWRQYGLIREKRLTPEQRAELARRAAAQDAEEAAAEAPGGADAADVSKVDTREERLDEIVDELMTGELPGMWTLLMHEATLHFDVYTLPLAGGQRVYALAVEATVESCTEDRLFLRVGPDGGVLPMDGDDPNGKGWMDTDEWNGDRIKKALREAAARLLDGEDAGKEAP